MQIRLAFALDCEPDLAWWALRSTRVMTDLYGPLVRVVCDGELPQFWQPGSSVHVSMRGLGIVPLGSQVVRPSVRSVDGGRVRIFRDGGEPVSGPMSLLRGWDHQMAVVVAPGGGTIWQDRLIIRGAAAPLLWPVLAALWQWRRQRITAMVPLWQQWRREPQADLH